MHPDLKSGGRKFGRRELRPTDEICPVSFEPSSATDATSAKWYETLATNVVSSRSTRRSWVVRHPQKRSFDRRSRDVRVATRRSEEKFTAAHVTSVEARAVTLSPGTRKPLVVLQAVLLTVNTSASAVE